MLSGLVKKWIATRQGFKPREVEEPIDYYWHRPLAGLLVNVLEPTRITPNQVTGLSGLASLCAGLAMLAAGLFHPLWMLAGAAILLLSIVLDCADGQLARIRGTSSPVGRILDGVMDSAAPLAVFHGMAAFLLLGGAPHVWVWPLGWATALSLLWHASSYDVAKNIHLHCTRPDFSLGGSTLFTIDEMRRLRRRLSAEGQGFHALLMGVWSAWTAPQVKEMAPWLEATRCPQNAAERELYRSVFGPSMAAMTWLGFGTHLFVLTVGALLAPIDTRAIWISWAIILGPMNLACLWISLGRRGRERRFAEELAALRAS